MQSELPNRLHPISLLFSVGSIARGLAIPILLALFATGAGYEAVFILFAIPAIGGAVVRYLTYRYRLTRDELVIREGILTRNERHVPFARIQNIDLVQNPLHRLFSVAEVRVETAGGGKPEATIRVLSLDTVEQLRRRILEGRETTAPGAAETSEPPASRPLHALDPREVFLFGVISNRGMVIVAAALGLLWQFDLWETIVERLQIESLDSLPQTSFSVNPWLATISIVALFVLVIVVMRGLSVVLAFLTLHGFSLSRTGDDLRTVSGLFTRVSRTIPRQRIQLLSTHHGPMHRWCGRAAVQVETAGSAEKDSGGSTRLWLAPLIRQERIPALLKEALPEIDLDQVHWQSVSPRAFGRLLRRSAAILIPMTVAGWFWIGSWVLLPAALFALAGWLNARFYVRHTAFALVPGGCCYRSGWWARRISVARFSKIQAVQLGESPFDRRRRMASIRVDTAGAGRIGHRLDISLLEAADATRLLERLSAEAGSTTFRW